MADQTPTVDISVGITEICLLAGGIRRPPLESALRDRTWSLAIRHDRTVFDLWLDRLYDLPSDGRPRVRVLLSEVPTDHERLFFSCRGVEIVTDSSDYRGPGGALRDATEHLHTQDTLLVAELSRCVLCGLDGMIAQHHERENLVTVAANHDGSPSGVYVIKAEAISHISPRGYVDLKEQWLPALRDARERIGVARLPGFGAMPLRTEHDFRDAMRQIAEPAVVITRPVQGPESGSPPSGGPSENGRIVVRSSIFPDGSIKASSDVVDGSSTGSPPLSDDTSSSDRQRSRGA